MSNQFDFDPERFHYYNNKAHDGYNHPDPPEPPTTGMRKEDRARADRAKQLQEKTKKEAQAIHQARTQLANDLTQTPNPKPTI